MCCFGTFIASAVSLHHVVANLPARGEVDPSVSTTIVDIVGMNYSSMLFNSLAASGTGVAISLLTLIYEVVPIVLRFLNIGLINLKIKIFLSVVSQSATTDDHDMTASTLDSINV